MDFGVFSATLPFEEVIWVGADFMALEATGSPYQGRACRRPSARTLRRRRPTLPTCSRTMVSRIQSHSTLISPRSCQAARSLAHPDRRHIGSRSRR